MKIVVSLTTIPPRAKFVQKTIDSLRKQSLQVDAIEVYLPRRYRREELGEFPTDALPRDCSIFWIDKDFGPASKVLPAIRHHQGEDIFLIYCDDDKVYDFHFVERLIKTAKENPGHAAAEWGIESHRQFAKKRYPRKNWLYRLRRFLSFYNWDPLKRDLRKVDIAAGFAGVAVRPEYFDELAFDIPDILWTVDDVWLSGIMQKNGHHIVLTDYSGRKLSRDSEFNGESASNISALKHFEYEEVGRIDANIRCILYMREKFGVFQGGNIRKPR